jgi:HSP20 family protein
MKGGIMNSASGNTRGADNVAHSSPSTLRGAHASGFTEGAASGRTYLPRADIWEGAEGLVVTLDMPGVEASGLDVHFERGTLTVTGTRSGVSFAKKSPLNLEWTEGQYRRSFQLSESLDAEHITAALKDGVLTLEIPRSEAQKPRKVPIRTVA